MKIYEISRLASWISFGAGVVVIFGLLFSTLNWFRNCLDDNCWSVFGSVMFNMFSRGGYVIGLSMILVPAYAGRLGPVKSFLSSGFFIVIARLNYSAYLLHLLVVYWFIYDLKSGMNINNL